MLSFHSNLVLIPLAVVDSPFLYKGRKTKKLFSLSPLSLYISSSSLPLVSLIKSTTKKIEIAAAIV